MQKLFERNHIHTLEYSASSKLCASVLNNSEGVRRGVPRLKTSDNNPDAALTAKGQAERNLRVSVVYVLNLRGKPLMPCSSRKARLLLKNKKAVVVSRTPFTIKLIFSTGETKQAISIGIDPGYKTIGISAISGKKELYASQINLRTNIVKLISKRSMFRRTRRGRLWHRKARFLNRVKTKKKGWLPPSVKHRLDSHRKAINFVKKILPISKIFIEKAAFDIQKIKNPSINGAEYQKGEQLDFFNVREYVLYRDQHKCRNCNGRSKDNILEVHHLESRQTGGNRPDNLVTLCRTCHKDYHSGIIKLKIRKPKGFKAETFMSLIRTHLVKKLLEERLDVEITYGYITKSNRIKQNLKKSHINDAFIIAGGKSQFRLDKLFFVKQVRKSNRKLFKGARSHIKNQAPLFVKGFRLFDKVKFEKKECFIWGRRITGSFSLKTLEGEKISGGLSYKKLVLLESAKTFLFELQSKYFEKEPSSSPT